MLYDPKWEVKPDVFSLESLISWLEKMPADGTYNFTLSRRCLLAQWAQSVDAVAHRAKYDGSFCYTVNGKKVDLESFMPIAAAGDATFGAALERARAAL